MKKATTNSIYTGEKLDFWPWKEKNVSSWHFYSTLYWCSFYLGQEKEINGIYIRRSKTTCINRWHDFVYRKSYYPLKQLLELKTQAQQGFPGGSDGKESTYIAGDTGLIPELGWSPGGRNGNPLQYSCLENFMN